MREYDHHLVQLLFKCSVNICLQFEIKFRCCRLRFSPPHTSSS